MSGLIFALLRHVLGYFLVLPIFLFLIALQVLVIGPVFKNTSTIAHFMYRMVGWFFGVSFRLNPNSAPIDGAAPTIFVANHLSRMDFVVLPKFPDAAVMMNAQFFGMPVFGPIIRVFGNSVGIIGTRQTQEHKDHDLGRIAEALSRGRHMFLFPEGIQTDGRRLLRYSKGAADVFYDPTYRPVIDACGPPRLQPVVLRVAKVNGRDVLDDKDSWGAYSLSEKRTNIFHGISRVSRIRSVVVDVLLCPAMSPDDFGDAVALMDAAHEATRKILVPEQSGLMTRREWRIRLDARDFSL